jgi:flagellar motor component MotA
LKNLVKLSLSVLAIERLPDWIGDLESLTELHISYSKKLKYIPDSLGKLKNLVKLDLFGLPIENLPDTIANCTSLEYVDICGTNISSVPNTISKVKTVRYSSIGLIPKEHYISYRSFCNCYYRLVEITLKFLEKARREGLLALEEDLETLNADFFKQGIRLVVDGTNAETIRHLMTLKIEREHGYYRKKLLETAMEGFLSIQSGTAETQAIFNLAALVDIKDNPIDAAISKYLAGDDEALEHIDFKSAILPEDECEEIRFIKRVTTMSIIFWAEGNLALEKHLNYDAIVAKDVFECGLLYIVDDWSVEEIDKNLSMLIALETNPVGRNLALAKKDAIRMIADGYPQRVFLETLLAYFDDSIIVEDLIDEFKLN